MAEGAKRKPSSNDVIGLRLLVLDISALASSRGTTAGAHEPVQIAQLLGSQDRIRELVVCFNELKKKCSICVCGRQETVALKEGLKATGLLQFFGEVRGEVAAPGDVVKLLLQQKQLAPGNAMLISQSLGHLLPARLGRWCQTFLLAPPRAGLEVQDMERILVACGEAVDELGDSCLPQFKGDFTRELSHHEVKRLQDASSALLDYLKMPTIGGIKGALVALKVPPPCGWVQERLEGACIVAVKETLTVVFTDELAEVMFEELLSAEMQPPAVASSSKRLTNFQNLPSPIMAPVDAPHHAAAGIASLFDATPRETVDHQTVQDPLPIMDDPVRPDTSADSALRATLAASQEEVSEAQRRSDMEDEALQLALQASQTDTAAEDEEAALRRILQESQNDSAAVDEDAELARILELSKVDQ